MGISLAKEEKANSYLIGGCVTLTEVSPWYVTARVKGSKNYHVMLRGLTEWSCTCPAGQHERECSHVVAVRKVVVMKPMPHEAAPVSAKEYEKISRLLGIA